MNGNSDRVAAMIVALTGMAAERPGGPTPVSYTELFTYFDAVRRLQPDLALQPDVQVGYRECLDKSLKALWQKPGPDHSYTPATVAEPNPGLLDREPVRRLAMQYRMFLASPPTRYDWIRSW